MLFLSLLFLVLNNSDLYNFSEQSPQSDWRVVNDVVMGGRSSGHYALDQEGNGHFFGEVSLENRGGFSSIRHEGSKYAIGQNRHIVIRLKGDGKRYQFRIKDEQTKAYSYITYFETNGDWQELRLKLSDFYPSFRGRQLDLPNFKASTIESLAFLIANKKAESFSLKLDWIKLAP